MDKQQEINKLVELINSSSLSMKIVSLNKQTPEGEELYKIVDGNDVFLWSGTFPVMYAYIVGFTDGGEHLSLEDYNERYVR